MSPKVFHIAKSPRVQPKTGLTFLTCKYMSLTLSKSYQTGESLYLCFTWGIEPVFEQSSKHCEPRRGQTSGCQTPVRRRGWREGGLRLLIARAELRTSRLSHHHRRVQPPAVGAVECGREQLQEEERKEENKERDSRVVSTVRCMIPLFSVPKPSTR